MKKSALLLAVVFIFLIKTSAQTGKSVLIKADEAFNTMSQEKGFRNAFLFYAADSVIKMNNKALPVIGKPALEQWLLTQDAKSPLQWKPVKAEISVGGDLGYTFGVWKLPAKDTTYYGNYVTIWKKQKDGSWKYVLDTGTSTPKPAEYQ